MTCAGMCLSSSGGPATTWRSSTKNLWTWRVISLFFSIYYYFFNLYSFQVNFFYIICFYLFQVYYFIIICFYLFQVYYFIIICFYLFQVYYFIIICFYLFQVYYFIIICFYLFQVYYFIIICFYLFQVYYFCSNFVVVVSLFFSILLSILNTAITTTNIRRHKREPPEQRTDRHVPT